MNPRETRVADEPEPTLLPAGTCVGSYRIEAQLGQGGMGTVYRALDLKLNRPVAIKLLSKDIGDPTARRRFQREAQMASSLNHPHIVTVHDAGEFEGRQYLVTEFVDGGTLKDWANAEKRTCEQIIELLTGVADGLAAAHSAGITHRDIKPANILVARNGYAKLADFGLAHPVQSAPSDDITRTLSEELTRSGLIVGTVAYMSPEQASGRTVDARSDIFSFGVVLYELAGGRRPFTAPTELEVLAAILHATPQPLGDDVPGGLRAAIEKALEKDPANRYQSMREMVVDLRRLTRQSGAEVAAPTPGFLNRRNLLLGGAGLSAAVFAGVFGIKTYRSPGQFASLAVLPLENLSGDPDQEYFADGMTAALITDLSKLRALKLISRKTAMRYKGSDKPPKQIAQELNVHALVEGSVAREAARVRVSAQLIDAATEKNLWADSYERDLTSVIALQGEVARAIAQQINVALRPEEEARLTATRKVNPATYEAYLRGMFWLNQGTPSAAKKGLGYFEQAVQNDPGDPLAYAGMALGYLAVVHGPDPPADALSRARAAAERALRLDPTLPEAQVASAHLLIFRDWEWEAALRKLDEALELNPNLALAHFYKSWVHVFFGRLEQAIAEQERGQELDPLALDWVYLGDLYRMHGRYDLAFGEATKLIELNPNFPPGHVVLAGIYSDQGKHEQAIAEYNKATSVNPTWKWYAGVGYAKAGQTTTLKDLLSELEQQPVNPWNAYWRATLNALLGNKDEAFRWLNYEPHFDWIPYFRVGDEFKPLRGDPRFAAALKRMNLPPL